MAQALPVAGRGRRRDDHDEAAGAPTLAFSLPAYGAPRVIDLLTGAVIGFGCLLISMLALPPVAERWL